ncbi:MAG TPA: hypothetical protein ENK75_06970 [Saprospiraceae bacterium]|nr:hypothetical protein [Saprospiraceae bacterium]HHH53147.1 hypothetical protein [Bacteroidota bacterium]
MNKKIILALSFIAFIFSSCHLDEKISFDLTFDSEANIPSSIGINIPFEIPIPPITTNINNELSSKNSKKEYLNTAKLKEINIKAIDPNDQDFGFLKKLEIYISADGLPELKIAEKLDIPVGNGPELSLDVYSNLDLANYIKKDQFNLRVRATSRKILLHSVKININTIVSVTTDIF